MRFVAVLPWFATACLTISCMAISGALAAEVTIYTAVDEPYARPVLEKFQKDTGIKVNIRTDAEATKTVGLAERLRAEEENPQADVWWGNEVFHTIRLADEGVLAPYESPSAKDIPDQFKHKKHLWTGMSVRVRVIAATQARNMPVQLTKLSDLLDPRLKNRICIARPTAGTTGGHVAALYVAWGDDKARDFFRKLKGNGVRMLAGNSVVAQWVGQGRMLAGLTDNDDVSAAQEQKLKLKATDADTDGEGSLGMPCTVALVKGARNPEAAKKLIDYLLKQETEQMLIDAKFARYSVRSANDKENGVQFLKVDYEEVAKKLPEAVADVLKILSK